MKLFSRLQNISYLASFIPLFLEMLDRIPPIKRRGLTGTGQNRGKVEDSVYGGSFFCFSKAREYEVGGAAVNVNASHIWRLKELAGFEGSGQDKIVKLTFISSFPESISEALQHLPDMKMLEISELILSTRVLTAKRTQEVAVAAKPGISKEPR